MIREERTMAFGPRDNPYDPTGPKIYACPGCAETFKTKRELKDHIKNVH